MWPALLPPKTPLIAAFSIQDACYYPLGPSAQIVWENSFPHCCLPVAFCQAVILSLGDMAGNGDCCT